MPTAPDGILTAEWDEANALVELSTSGSAWAVEPATVTITRATAAEGTVTVRNLEQATALGGVVIGSDTEILGFDQSVTYAATGYDALGDALETSTIAVSTPYAAWGLVIRVPGQGALTARVGLVRVARSRGTLGGTYEIPSGPQGAQAGSRAALAQSGGVAALRATIEVQTRTAAEANALDAIVASAPGQVVLLQTGLPVPRIPSGYYFVQSVTPDGGAQGAIRGGYEVENHVLQLTEAGIPAGSGSDWSGTTWDDVLAAFPTWQDVVDDVDTWLDLARGEW